MFKKVKDKIEKSQVYQTENGYKYFVYPYKGLTLTDPKELDYIAQVIANKISKDVDFIFTFEVDGIFIAYKTASLLNKPFICAKEFHYNLKDPIKIIQKTGYYEREMFFSLDGYKPRKVAIVDCLHSTGGTIKEALRIFKELEIEVTDICVAVNKINYNNQSFLNEMKDKFFAIYDVEIINDKVIAQKSTFFK